MPKTTEPGPWRAWRTRFKARKNDVEYFFFPGAQPEGAYNSNVALRGTKFADEKRDEIYRNALADKALRDIKNKGPKTRVTRKKRKK